MPLYFAYGSNMESAQMVSRCPSAVFVDKAILDRHRVTFPIMSARWQGGAASIEPQDDSLVEGVVYKMDDADFVSLDRFEGVAKQRYYRTHMAVRLASGNEVSTEVYIANPEPDAPFPPNVGYLNQMITGATEHGLSEKYIASLKAIETVG